MTAPAPHNFHLLQSKNVFKKLELITLWTTAAVSLRGKILDFIFERLPRLLSPFEPDQQIRPYKVVFDMVEIVRKIPVTFSTSVSIISRTWILSSAVSVASSLLGFVL